MMNAQNEIVKTTLKHLFSKNHFDICTIDKLTTITGCIPNKEIYSKLSALHCINYSEMSKELRDWVYKETLLMFIPNGFDMNIIDAVFETDSDVKIIRLSEQPKTFLQRLLK